MHRLIALSLLRFLARSKVSVTMAVLGIGIATASVVSVHLVSVRVEAQLNNLVPAPLQNYNYFLYQDQAIPIADYAQLRRQWRQGEYPQLQSLTPVIDERVQLEGDWIRLIGLDLVGGARGDWLQERGDIETENNVVWNGAWVDDSLAQLTSVPVNGTLNLPAGVMVTDIGRAQQLLGWHTDQVSYLAADMRTGTGVLMDLVDRLLPGFSAGLPATEPESIDDWRLVAFDRQHPGIDFGRSVLFNVSALATLSLVVAWFLIYQVALNWLRRLSFVFERLHGLGLPYQTCAVYYLALLSVVGTVAWLLGLALGAWGAELLLSGMDAEARGVSLDIWVVLKALGCAVGVALLSGWSCWVRYVHTLQHRAFNIVWVTVMLMALAVVGIGVGETGLVGGFVAIAAIAFSVVLLISPSMVWVRHLTQRAHLMPKQPLSGLSLLALREAFWFPRELSIALAGLVLAVGTAIGVGLMVASFRLDFTSFLEQRLAYDVSVEGEREQLLAVQKTANNNPSNVERLQIYRQGQLRYQGEPVELRVTVFDDFEQARYGTQLQQPALDALVNEQFARRFAVTPGSMLTIVGQSARIAGIVQGFGDTQPRLLVDQTHGIAAVAATSLSAINLNSSEPAALAGELAQRFPTLEVTNATVLQQTALATFDRTFVITSILTTIALVVAGVGLYIGVTSLRLNRRGSTRLLVSLGATTWENIQVDLWRSLVMGGTAVVMALPLGILLGWLLCMVINPRAFGWSIQLHLDQAAILMPCVWGVAAALFAGVLRLGAAEEGAIGVWRAP